MKRTGHVIEEIVDYSNMEESFRSVLRGNKRKRSRAGRGLIACKEEVIQELSSRIADGSFQVNGYHQMDVVEGGKLRHIQVISYKDRIAAHAVMSVVDKHLRRRFIRTTSASIKGRGMHDLMNYIRRDVKDDPEGTRYCYKFDISKFYESIDHDTILSCIRRVFKDEKLIQILDGFVRMMPQGLSIGLRSSQGLGNLLLSQCLDHWLKEECGIKHFYRYCDDGVILASSKEELWQIRELIHKRVEKFGLHVKSNDRVFPIEEGIDFLGYVIRPDYVRLRKRNKKNFARKIRTIKSKRRRRELIASFYGITKHADCRYLFSILTGKNMRDFKSLNVSYQPADGKKRFNGVMVSIRELVNLEIVVHDFETDIKTQEGEGRCLVSIEQNGEMKKFFTNSEEMKSILAQVHEIPDGFPFKTTIKTESFGKGKTKYVFS
jgi:retron-type reverse transcriptase